jgi:capsular exopolysaccharide synthesis family protein
MGKTHEALEWAEKEYQISLPKASRGWDTAPGTKTPQQVFDNLDMERYQDLKVNLLTRYPDTPIKTILFTATTHGDGASTTAINFATTLARECHLNVLLVDVNLRTPSLHDVFHIDSNKGLSNVLSNSGKLQGHIHKIGPGGFYVLPSGSNHSVPVSLFESARFDRFLTIMRERFDYVIMDAPPFSQFSDARVICSKIDGVILVLKSGTTRRQVALRVKKEIEDSGGKLLGVVMNKQKYYIPRWIYKRL